MAPRYQARTMGHVEVRQNRIPAMQAGTGGAVRQIIAKLCFDIEADTKRNIVAMDAVDTGNMLNTTYGKPITDTYGEVHVPAEYSEYVHEGYVLDSGRNVVGRPFMRKAVDKNMAECPLTVQDKLGLRP